MATVLGQARWMDPDRRRSVNQSLSATMRRSLFYWHRRTAYGVMEPALSPLTTAYEAVNRLVASREEDFWNGESTRPGCAMDISMHGHNIDDAQPAIIYSSTSGRCRQNAKSIIQQEGIVVDRRGIDLEFYPHGVIFYAAPSSRTKYSPADTGIRPHKNSEKRLTFSQGVLIDNGSRKCTIGGVVMVGRKMCSLTVAHASEEGDSTFDITSQNSSVIVRNAGTVWRKRSLHKKSGSNNYDWALCELDDRRVAVINQATLSDGTVCCPSQIATNLSNGQAVVVSTGPHGLVKGKIMSTYSLVALPGSTSFQRMCSVVLERPIGVGASGAWVFDAGTGDLCGHIVAGNPTTTLAYLIPAQQIFDDIADETGEVVTLPTLDDFRPIPEEVIKPVSPRTDSSQSRSISARFWATCSTLRCNRWQDISLFLVPLCLILLLFMGLFFVFTMNTSFVSAHNLQELRDNGWHSKESTLPALLDQRVVSSALASFAASAATHDFQDCQDNFQYVGYSNVTTSSVRSAILWGTILWNTSSWNRTSYGEEDHVAWVQTPPIRGTMDVLWSSVWTMLLCALVLFLSVPGPRYSTRRTPLHTITGMLLAFLTPELNLVSARYQYIEARSLAESFHDSLVSTGATDDWIWDKELFRRSWTMAQCHYSSMGGYAVSFEHDEADRLQEPLKKHRKHVTLPASAVRHLFLTDWDHLEPHFLSTAAIRDRSKSSSLVHALVAMQILWMWSSYLGRTIQQLPLTTVEIISLGHTILAVIFFFFSRDRPYGLELTTTIPLRALSTSAQTYIKQEVLSITPSSPSTWDRMTGLQIFESSFKISELWAFARKHLLVYVAISGVTLLLSLQTVLPSPVEQTLWRLSMATMAVVWSIILFGPIKVVKTLANAQTMFLPEKSRWNMLTPRFSTLVVGYCMIRIYILVQSVIGLRWLPHSVYQTPDWSLYVPHI